MSNIVDDYANKFRQLIFEFITEEEEILYEDIEHIYITNPAGFGMLELNKQTMKATIDNAIEHNKSDCVEQLLYDIRWAVIYWGTGYNCDEADKFLKSKGVESPEWL